MPGPLLSHSQTANDHVYEEPFPSCDLTNCSPVCILPANDYSSVSSIYLEMIEDDRTYMDRLAVVEV